MNKEESAKQTELCIDTYTANMPKMQAGKVRKTLEKRYTFNGGAMSSAEHVLKLYLRYGKDAIDIVDIVHGVPDIDQRVIDRAFDTFNIYSTKEVLKSAGLWHDTELSHLFMSDKTGYGGSYRTEFKNEVVKSAQRHSTTYQFFKTEGFAGTGSVYFTMSKTEYDFIVWVSANVCLGYTEK
jgi:hypothetical protein